MSQRFQWGMSFGIGVLLVMLSQTKPTVAATTQRLATGQIVQIEGEVKLLRSRDRALIPTLGTSLYANDRLIAASGAHVQIQCTDLSIQTVPAGAPQANPCQSQPAAQKAQCPGLIQCPHRGDRIVRHDATLPAIISPRRTALLEAPPTLRWQAVAGASQYAVLVEDAQTHRSLWETLTPQTSIPYEGLPLQPGRSYWLIVEADTGTSSLDETTQPGSGSLQFRRLSESETDRIRQAEQRIRQRDWTASTKRLLLANLYTRNGLFADAIAQLESLKQPTEANAAPLCRRLGDLYWRYLGVAPQARVAYGRAVAIADPADLEERAAALHGLAETLKALRQDDEAIDRLTAALNAYQAAGDLANVQIVKQQLKQWQQQ